MLSFFPRGVLDEILNLTESMSEGLPTYSCDFVFSQMKEWKLWKNTLLFETLLHEFEDIISYFEIWSKKNSMFLRHICFGYYII